MSGFIEKREKIEWLNYWIEDANLPDKKRVLLIGDSVTRQYRKCLNNILKSDGCIVDIIAMSFSMFDRVDIELGNFINTLEYHYDYVVFHLGAHHGYWIDCYSDTGQRMLYKEYLLRILGLLSKKGGKIITVAGTPECGETEAVREHNKEIEARNALLSDVSNMSGYEFCDLYSAVKEQNFRYTDCCHFVRSADEYVANRIAEAMLGRKMHEVLNLVDSLKELNEMACTGNIYIFGNGKRGENLFKYFSLTNREVLGYVVSEAFYKNQSRTYMLKDILGQKDGALMIVTALDYAVYKELSDYGINYISLSDRIYIYIEEHINAYSLG